MMRILLIIIVAFLPVLSVGQIAGTTAGQGVGQSGSGRVTGRATEQSTGQRAEQHPTEREVAEMSEQYGKLVEFYRILAGNYLDTMDYEAIVERGIVSMLAELDPHSVYLTEEEQRAAREELGGGFSGIGIEFNVLSDTIIVANTIAGGPAERVGLASGDRIVEIDGENVVGMARAEVPKHLRGPKGTKVVVGVLRRGEVSLLNFAITRDDIPLNTIDAAYKPDPETGYIKVNRFGATTSREFVRALAGLGDVDGLIVDLRGNGGGYLPEAIRMSEFFLSAGQRVVSTEGNMYPSQVYTAGADGHFSRGRLIIMVNEVSASASEIVSGAVQDWDRGIVVGRQTFGKGLVQREFRLDDGSAVRLTIARYLTPAGRAIQRPYTPGRSEDYYREVAERYSGGGADSVESSVVARSDLVVAGSASAVAGPEYRTLRTGRVVYGGGGITPDVLIPADTTGYSAYWARLNRAGIIIEFVYNYLADNRSRIAAEYPDIEGYIAGFDSEALVEALVDYAVSRGVERDEEGLEKSREWFKSQLKALVARQLWDTGGYVRVGHATFDGEFRQAHLMMSRWRSFGQNAPVTDELMRRLSQNFDE